MRHRRPRFSPVGWMVLGMLAGFTVGGWLAFTREGGELYSPIIITGGAAIAGTLIGFALSVVFWLGRLVVARLTRSRRPAANRRPVQSH
jgi:amino acid transporter